MDAQPLYQRMNAYILKKTTIEKADAESLKAQGRQDEANFARIRCNVYEIFAAVMSAQLYGSDFGQAVQLKFTQITLPWHKKLERAKAHNDYNAQAVEETKLACAREILNVWEAQV